VHLYLPPLPPSLHQGCGEELCGTLALVPPQLAAQGRRAGGGGGSKHAPGPLPLPAGAGTWRRSPNQRHEVRVCGSTDSTTTSAGYGLAAGADADQQLLPVAACATELAAIPAARSSSPPLALVPPHQHGHSRRHQQRRYGTYGSHRHQG
jgi:hypothetical protein